MLGSGAYNSKDEADSFMRDINTAGSIIHDLNTEMRETGNSPFGHLKSSFQADRCERRPTILSLG